MNIGEFILKVKKLLKKESSKDKSFLVDDFHYHKFQKTLEELEYLISERERLVEERKNLENQMKDEIGEHASKFLGLVHSGNFNPQSYCEELGFIVHFIEMDEEVICQLEDKEIFINNSSLNLQKFSIFYQIALYCFNESVSIQSGQEKSNFDNLLFKHKLVNKENMSSFEQAVLMKTTELGLVSEDDLKEINSFQLRLVK